MRILFVENHAIFARTVVEQLLSRHDVVICPSLAEARRAVQRVDFDVALVDYDLDDGKGDTLVAELRGRRPRLRIVAVSAHDGGNERLRRAGADATCRKAGMSEIERVLDDRP
ncbi:MAG TPA: response regulator [Sandaracinaceae bacterium LLY-WYZ-13_1]|nr:response regulator [Sandaracinaceae bacterium LLY-WYZ-13_1]